MLKIENNAAFSHFWSPIFPTRVAFSQIFQLADFLEERFPLPKSLHQGFNFRWILVLTPKTLRVKIYSASDDQFTLLLKVTVFENNFFKLNFLKMRFQQLKFRRKKFSFSFIEGLSLRQIISFIHNFKIGVHSFR